MERGNWQTGGLAGYGKGLADLSLPSLNALAQERLKAFHSPPVVLLFFLL